VYPSRGGLKDLKLPWPMLVCNMCLLLSLESLRTLSVPRRVGSSAVHALLRAMEFRAIDLTLGVRRSCAVAAPRFVLAVPSNVAELVAAEAPTDSKVWGVWFTVKDLGLPDEAALAQSSRRVGAAKVKDDSGESCCRRSRWFYL
jgi:hypothetical protein